MGTQLVFAFSPTALSAGWPCVLAHRTLWSLLQSVQKRSSVENLTVALYGSNADMYGDELDGHPGEWVVV